MSDLNETLDPMDKGTNRLKIGCWAVVLNLFFALSLLWGVDEAYAAWQLQTNGIVTQGIVVRLDEEYSEGECCVYRPVIQFEVNEQVYTFNSTWASDPPKYQVGEQVNVRHDPTDPNTAGIDSLFERWIFPTIALSATISITLAANFFMLREWKLAGDD